MARKKSHFIVADVYDEGVVREIMPNFVTINFVSAEFSRLVREIQEHTGESVTVITYRMAEYIRENMVLAKPIVEKEVKSIGKN